MPDHETNYSFKDIVMNGLDVELDPSNLQDKVHDQYKIFLDYYNNGCKLTEENYVTVLRTLTEFEDLFSEMELDELSLENRKFTLSTTTSDRGDVLYDMDVLDVPELPPVSEGDGLRIKKMNDDEMTKSTQLKALIIKATYDTVTFTLMEHKNKKLNLDESYNVRFTKDRTAIRMEKEAILSLEADIIRDTLMPTKFEQQKELKP